MRILGFSQGAHDASYAILEDGKIIIHEELERLNRIKETNADISEFFVNHRGSLDDFDYLTGVAHGNDKYHPSLLFDRFAKADHNVRIVGHHVSHAANAFFGSEFDSALIFSIDGGGWDYININKLDAPTANMYGDTHYMEVGASTVWYGEGNKIKPVYYTYQPNIGGTWELTARYVFNMKEECSLAGTIMGMAAHGTTEQFKDHDYNFMTEKEFRPQVITLTEQERFNYAAALQEWTEYTLRNLMEPYITKYKAKNICLTGGVALNCVFAGKLKRWFNLDNVFIPPVPYDAGLAMGSAQYLYHHVLDHPRSYHESYKTPYLGNEYDLSIITKELELRSDLVTFETVTDNTICNLLEQQNIISIYGGRSESGRRALGNRSIIADPRQSTMRELINEKTKHRDWFRPLAPSILEEHVSDWFTEVIDSPYMSFAIPFREEKKLQVSAVVHKDGTGRLQTVNEKFNPRYYALLKSWYQHTGIPILLNTSFNNKEPIVETPSDALNCFLNTQIDYLYFTDHNILVKKVRTYE